MTHHNPENSSKKFSSMAWKASIDMISGIIVGSVVGWFLGSWVDYKATGIIIGFLLGSAAGFLSIIKTLRQAGYNINLFSRKL